MPVFLSIDPGSLLTSLFHLLMFWKNVDYAGRIGLGRFKPVAFGLAGPSQRQLYFHLVL